MIPALLGAWRALRERARPAAPPPRSAALELAQREAVFHDPSGLDERSVKALGRTFAKLRQLEARRVERVAVLQLGASHTAGQYFPDEVRRLLQQRFGDAGRGYVAPGEPEGDRPHTGVERQREGFWRIEGAVGRAYGQKWGLTGIRAEASPGASLSLHFCPECTELPVPARLGLHYLETPDMGQLEVRLGGQPVALLPRPGRRVREETVRIERLAALGASQTLEVKNLGPGPVTLLGAWHELAQSGVVYDALGLSGSTADVPDGYEPGTFVTQLRARAPDLYILFWGTNESVRPTLNPEEYTRQYTRLLATLRRGAPQADCLILGPTDRLVPQAEDEYSQAPSQYDVIRTLRQVAWQNGCAFWSPRAAMGGEGSMMAWMRMTPALGLPDGTHLTPEGYRVLAGRLVTDLMAAYEASRPKVPPRAARTGPQRPAMGSRE